MDTQPINLRLPRKLHAQLKKEAGTTFGLSLNTYMVNLLASHPDRRKTTNK
jgi:predicted HicB family RNase H-like nuclease